MPRPKQTQPTPGELEVLKTLWDRGPSTVREVMEALNRRRRRAYTSVMSLLNVMTDKRLVRRRLEGRAYLYEANVERQHTLGGMVHDLVSRAFEGSAGLLVSHLLDETRPDSDELAQIRRAIEQYQREQRGQT